MDREEQEESSSSQNVRLFLTEIRRGAGKGDICLVSDGSSFLMPPGFAGRHGLSPGKEFSEEELSFLKRRAFYVSTRSKALELLAYREHSRYQLYTKLIRKGYREDIIPDVLDDLERDGSLDEERFCSSWIRSRISRHPEWGAVLVAGLMKNGIGRDMAERTVRHELESLDEDELISRLGEKLMRSRRITREKLIKKLIMRGFSYNRVIHYSNTLD